MFLSDVSIKRPVFATMLMVLLVVLGLVSYQRLAIDEYPDVTYPVISVQTGIGSGDFIETASVPGTACYRHSGEAAG